MCDKNGHKFCNKTLGGILTTCNTTLGGIFAQTLAQTKGDRRGSNPRPLDPKASVISIRLRLHVRRDAQPIEPATTPPARFVIRKSIRKSTEKSTRFCQGARPILTTCLTIFDCQSQMIAHWDNIEIYVKLSLASMMMCLPRRQDRLCTICTLGRA